MSIDLRDKKTLLIVIGAVIVIGLLAFWFFGRSSNSSGEISDTTMIEVYSDPVELIIGQELLLALESMRLVQLDVSFLNDPTFDSLEDFTVEIPRQPIGRRDPFAPIGR